MTNKIKDIDPITAFEKRKNDPTIALIDVRTPQEFSEIAAQGALNFELEGFDANAMAEKFNLNKTAPLYLICRSGARSFKAAEMCVLAGFTDVYNVVGGTLRWHEDSLPLME